MNEVRALAIALLVLFPPTAFAQLRSLSVVVHDREGKVITRATITISFEGSSPPLHSSAVTDSTGHFTLSWLPMGQ